MSTAAKDAEQSLATAHAKLLAARDLQFDFVAARSPPPPPDWLADLFRALAKAFEFAAPFLKYVFWGGLILGVALIAWFILRDLVRIRTGGRVKPANLGAEPEAWRPGAAKAAALLSDADALAAQGRFAEAVHLILERSIDDFAGRRPGVVRPALTSRDLARLEAMPAEARGAFSAIAQVVEASLFGGRPVDADGFAGCRRAYHDFALSERWA